MPHVLIVLGEGKKRRQWVEAFSARGVSVSCASNLAEANERIETQNFDGVVIDCKVRAGRAVDFCREVRQLVESKGATIDVVLCLTDPSEILSALEAGAASYVLPDTPLDELVDRVCRAVGEPAASAPSERTQPGTGDLLADSPRAA